MNSFSPGIRVQPSSDPSLDFQLSFSDVGKAKKSFEELKRAVVAVCIGWRPGVGGVGMLMEEGGGTRDISVDMVVGGTGREGDGWGNVTIAQPRFGSVCWFSGSTSGIGDGFRRG